MIKALQMSDIHLGFQYNRLPAELAEIRRQELMQTFRNGLKFAQTQQVDFLLLPGDIFDGPKPERSLVQDVRDALADIAPVRVMIAAGNHDYAYPGSVWLEKDKWPENVYIFPPYWTHFDFPELHAQIWGASFSAPYQYVTLLQPVDDKPGELQIGVLHGDAYTPDHSVYNPLPQAAIAGSKLNWLALGHIHKEYQDIAGDTAYAYAGAPEGHGFDELGEKGVLLLTFADGQPTDVPALLHTFYVQIQEDTHPAVNYAALAQEDTLIGNFTQKMLHAIDNADEAKKPQLQAALQYGIEAFKGGITNED